MCSLRLAKLVVFPDNAAKIALGNTLLSWTGVFLATILCCTYFEVEVKQCHRLCQRVMDEFYPCGKQCGLGSLKAMAFYGVPALTVTTGSLLADLLLCFGVAKINRLLCKAWLLVKSALTAFVALAFVTNGLIAINEIRSEGSVSNVVRTYLLIIPACLISLDPIINVWSGFQMVCTFQRNLVITDNLRVNYFVSSAMLISTFCLIPPVFVSLISLIFVLPTVVY